MAKFTHDDILDAPANAIAAAVTKEVVCSAQPTTYAEANSTYKLAEVSFGSGDVTKANGDSSGRKAVYAAKNGVLIAASGTATHIALLDATNSKVLEVTTCASQALTANGTNTVNIPAWDSEYADPS